MEVDAAGVIRTSALTAFGLMVTSEQERESGLNEMVSIFTQLGFLYDDMTMPGIEIKKIRQLIIQCHIPLEAGSVVMRVAS